MQINTFKLNQNIIKNMLQPYIPIATGFDNINQFRFGKQKFEELKRSLYSRYIGMKFFRPDYLPQKIVNEIVMMLAVMNKKYENIKKGKQNAQQQISMPISRRKNQIMEKSGCSEQQFENYINDMKRATHYIQQFSVIVKKYEKIIYHTVLSICGKEGKILFFFRIQVQYTNEDFKKFAREFSQNICYLNYDQLKSISKQFQTATPTAIYILKAKNRYMLLYPPDISQSASSKSSIQAPSSTTINHKGSIRIIQSNFIPALSVEQIFTKKNVNMQNNNRVSLPVTPSRQQASIRLQTDNYNNSPSQQKEPKLLSQSSIKNSQVVIVPSTTDRQSIGQDSILFLTKVKCTVCQKIFSQIDCIYWNYLYYCHQCVCDINVDISDIPPLRIQKFLRDRNNQSWNYTILCPECQAITQIRGYNPAKKNRNFICSLCNKTICIKHKVNVYNCFCYCKPCKTPTFYLQRLKINFCQICRQRFCFKCNKKGKSFCKCVCKNCLEEQSKTHECQAACHSCNNKPTKLRQCRCGLFICYGCYYQAVEASRQDKVFPCNQGQYV